MCLADYADHDRALLDSLLCIFDLEDSALGGAVEKVSFDLEL